jgi:putative ABC transport system permease protein
MSAWNRLLTLFRREQLDHELDTEIRSHIELATDDYIQRGMPYADAQRQARLRFGAVEASKDAHRDARGLAWLEGLAYDLRFAIRGLARDRGFTLTAITTLALAIGLNATVFAVVNTMLFRGFPLVKDNDRLLYMQERYTLRSCCLLYPDFLAWREHAKSFQELALVSGKLISMKDGAGTRDTRVTTVTANAFQLLGVAPVMGRDFASADEAPGAPQVLMLTYRSWVERFGKRSDIIGHSLTIDKAPATVIGVMPEGFDFPEHGLFWMPLQATEDMLDRKPSGFMAVGRLASGASKANAQTELDVINRRLENEFPVTNKGVRARLFDYSRFELGPEAAVIYGSLWAAALFVLLIACANLANLTLARTLGRAREFSTRIALGAGHWRMVRQIFTESLLVAAAGGAIGWWLAKWGVRIWADATWSRYVVLDYSAGAGSIEYLVGITLAAALLFGLIPVVKNLRPDVNNSLQGDGRNGTVGRNVKRFASVLITGQMTLAIVLLAGAGVLARSLWNIVGAKVGVRDADKVLVGFVSVPREDYPSADARNAFWDRLRSRLVATPGVESVSLAETIPVGNPVSLPFELGGGQTEAPEKPTVATIAASTRYLHTVGALTIEGREFLDSDRPGSPPVAIVNQSFVAQYWPGEDPLGKRLRVTRDNQPSEWRTVVGVASNVMQNRPLRDRFVPIVYVSFRQQPSAGAALFVRTWATAGQLAARVRRTIEAAAPGVELEDYSTLAASFAFDRGRMDLEHAELGKNAAIAPIFAISALLLAVVGLYAVVAHSVRQRTKEIGIRMAIGAAPKDVCLLIFREGMRPVVVGLIFGLAASLAVNRVLRSQLVNVSPYDSLTFTLAPLLLICVALLGCALPIRQATRVDPATALRED